MDNTSPIVTETERIEELEANALSSEERKLLYAHAAFMASDKLSASHLQPDLVTRESLTASSSQWSAIATKLSQSEQED